MFAFRSPRYSDAPSRGRHAMSVQRSTLLIPIAQALPQRSVPLPSGEGSARAAAHLRSRSAGGNAKNPPIAWIDGFLASGCYGLLVGDDLGHRPVLVEGPALAR